MFDITALKRIVKTMKTRDTLRKPPPTALAMLRPKNSKKPVRETVSAKIITPMTKSTVLMFTKPISSLIMFWPVKRPYSSPKSMVSNAQSKAATLRWYLPVMRMMRISKKRREKIGTRVTLSRLRLLSSCVLV